MKWRWEVIVKGSKDGLYHFRGRGRYKERVECVTSLNDFMAEEMQGLLIKEGELNPTDLEVVDVTITYGR